MNKIEWQEFMNHNFTEWSEEEKLIFAKYILQQMIGFQEDYERMAISSDHIAIHKWLVEKVKLTET